MPVTASASLLTADPPAPVQVVINGLTVGDTYSVVGKVGDWTWAIPGGVGTATGTTVILVDNRAPLNGPVTYVATVNGTPYTSGSVTVTAPAFMVLQDLAGLKVVICELASSKEPQRKIKVRNGRSDVAGRSDLGGRYDVSLADAYTLPVEADGTDALTLLSLIRAGGAIVRRNDVAVLQRNTPPTEILAFDGDPDYAPVGVVGTLALFVLPVQVMGEPEPGIVLVAFGPSDFNTVYAASTQATFNSEWSPQTQYAFNTYNWGQRL